jgi:hypothetical protein
MFSHFLLPLEVSRLEVHGNFSHYAAILQIYYRMMALTIQEKFGIAKFQKKRLNLIKHQIIRKQRPIGTD